MKQDALRTDIILLYDEHGCYDLKFVKHATDDPLPPSRLNLAIENLLFEIKHNSSLHKLLEHLIEIYNPKENKIEKLSLPDIEAITNKFLYDSEYSDYMFLSKILHSDQYL